MAKSKNKKMKCEHKHHCCMILGKAFWLTLFAVFLAHYLSGICGVEKMAAEGSIWGWIALFVWYMIFMIVGMKLLWLIHPKKAFQRK